MRVRPITDAHGMEIRSLRQKLGVQPRSMKQVSISEVKEIGAIVGQLIHIVNHK